MKTISHFNFIGWLIILGFISCQNVEQIDDISTVTLQAKEQKNSILGIPISLIADNNFQQGFSVLNPNNGTTQGTIQYPGVTLSPKWNLAQWYSTSSISGASPSSLSSGSYMFADANKAITIGPVTSSDGHLIFAINGQNEFGNVYRTASQPFPHLIVDQRIADPDGWLGTATPFLGTLDSLVFQIDANLIYHARNQKNGYNPSIHALQFSSVFLVQNLRAGSPGYGKSMYFLIMLFDDRYNLPGLSINEDIFSGQLIYDVGLAAFSQEGLLQGQWKTVKGNLLPMIKQGLNEAWRRGYLLESRDYNDYKVSLFTLGFECTGLNIGTIQVRNLNLVAY